MSDFYGPLKTIITRKDHQCVCFEMYKDSGYCTYDLPGIYAESVAEAGKTNGAIPKGTVCYMWSGKHDGEMFTSYAFKGMHGLACHMDWWD